MYWDWTYFVIVVPMLLLSMIAQARVKSTFNKYSKVTNSRGLTASMAVRKILDGNGLHDIQITRIPGNLTDHYDPRTNVIALSESVYDSTSVAAIGVAAHEAGHAIQHAENYLPSKIRTAIVPVTQFGAKLSMPLFFLGLILSFYPLSYAGILLFGTTVIFQLVTLPTEFNASNRAIKTLDSGGYLDSEDIPKAKKVLSAAAMTYIAALAVSLASFLRLLLIVGGRNNKKR